MPDATPDVPADMPSVPLAPVPAAQPQKPDLVVSLASSVCPACGGAKHAGSPLCTLCKQKLQANLAANLVRASVNPKSSQYAQLLDFAMHHLGAKEFHVVPSVSQ